MRKRILHFYDKIIIASIVGVLTLIGCCRKTYPEKKPSEQTEQKTDSIRNSDTLKTIKDKFDRRVIAMYGVRPARETK